MLSFARNSNTDSRYSSSNYYVPKVEIKDFNALIDGKGSFDLPVKNEEEAYENFFEMSNNDYTTGNLFDFAYFKKNYTLIAIDLSKQTKLKDPQQISFIGKLSRNTGATMFCIIKKSEETTFNLSQNCHNHINNGNTKYCKFIKQHWQWKFATKKWHVIESESKGNYSKANPIKFLIKSIESYDAYILVTGNITTAPNNNVTQVAFKNYAPFWDCGTETNDTFVDYADFINIRMPMYNLIEYSDNYS